MPVYFIKQENSDFVKVGFTTSTVESRLRGIQTGNPSPLKIIGIIPDGDAPLETALHYYFRKTRVSGEWFTYSSAMDTFLSDFVHSGKSAAVIKAHLATFVFSKVTLPDISATLIETFLIITQTGGFMAAAETMGITQPSLTVRIQRLEEFVGVSLFERSTRPISLTDEGACLLPYFEAALEAMQEIVNRASTF